MDQLQNLLLEIKELKRELLEELQQKQEEFFYKVKGKRVYFERATRRYHKTLMTRIHIYIIQASLLNILTVPFIYGCFLPAAFLDVVVSVYQMICFRIYGIPRVKRRDYIVIDRHALSYLNTIEKINCVYCGYFNGLIGYITEIAARTEQFWCPIKHARRVAALHDRYNKFFEYGDATSYKERFQEVRRDFADLKKTDEDSSQ